MALDALAKTLRDMASQIETAALEQTIKDGETGLKITKLERGNETLQEVIKMKDDAHKEIVDSYKDALTALRGGGNKKPDAK